jgi:hypothetical protein
VGSVKIDIYQSDRKYYDMSFSSALDIYDMLWILDVIYNDYINGNCEALVIINDLKNYIDTISDNSVIQTYYEIQTGCGELDNKDYNKDILQIISEKLDISKDDCEKQLYYNVVDIVKLNKTKWNIWYNNNYKNKKVLHKNTLNYFSKIPDEIYWQKDYSLKYILNKHIYRESDLPNDLLELIDISNKNKIKLKELKCDLKKCNNLSDKQNISSQIKKRNKYDIEISQDITLIKKHYCIPLSNNGPKEKLEEVCYEDIENTEFIDKSNDNNIIDEFQLNKIKILTNNILTTKQRILFELRFVLGLGIIEISNMLGVSQPFVSKEISKIIKKNTKFILKLVIFFEMVANYRRDI